jgi:hypothetical protein
MRRPADQANPLMLVAGRADSPSLILRITRQGYVKSLATAPVRAIQRIDFSRSANITWRGSFSRSAPENSVRVCRHPPT